VPFHQILTPNTHLWPVCGNSKVAGRGSYWEKKKFHVGYEILSES